MILIDRISRLQRQAFVVVLYLSACALNAGTDPEKVIAEGDFGWNMLGSSGNLATGASYSADSALAFGLPFGESANRSYFNEGGFFIRRDVRRTISRNDFDGDRRTDVWYYDSNSGTWYFILSSLSNDVVYTLNLGGPDALACPEDYDGDGHADPCVYWRLTGKFEILPSDSGYVLQTCSCAQDGMPASGDYDGDGYADFAVFVPETKSWTVLLSMRLYAAVTFSFGESGDIPVPADFDGDGLTDYALYRPKTGLWKIAMSSERSNIYSINLGGQNYLPVQGDYDGDLRADPVVYGLSDGRWHGFLSAYDYQYVSAVFAPEEGMPCPGDYDNDGVSDPAVLNSELSALYLIKSTEGYAVIPHR